MGIPWKGFISGGRAVGSRPTSVGPSFGNAQPLAFLKPHPVRAAYYTWKPPAQPPALWGQWLPLAKMGMGAVTKVTGGKEGSGVGEKKEEIRKEMGLACCKSH